MTNLVNKKAIVTGGLNGLGKKVAETLLKHDAKVTIFDIAEKSWPDVRLEWSKTFSQDSFNFIRCDVCNRLETISAFEKAITHFNGLDIVINNAGIVDEGNWEKCVDINLTAMIRVAYIGINLMSKANGKNGGVIINSASMAGLTTFGYPVYCATKHALTAFTRSIASIPGFLDMHGVRVNSVCLGFSQTDIVKPQDFKQTGELDGFPSIDHVNKIKDKVLDELKFEDMIPVDKAASLYFQIINDSKVHGRNLFYNSIKQKKPYYHEHKF